MKEVKYLLIGGGMAAANAAKMIRRADAEGSILLVSEEKLPPYDRPPLSKEYLRKEWPTEKLFFDPIEKLNELKIDLALGVHADHMDASAKTVALSDGETIHYEKALLATGGRPIVLRMPGADLKGVHYLRTAEDAEGIANDTKEGTKALIIGAGFIGLEVAASLSKLGAEVTVVEAMDRIWPRFADARLALFVQEYCSLKGINFVTGEMVSELRGEGRVTGAVTRSGKEFACDMIVIGVGLIPNVELAQEAGLEVNNGIVVDEQLRTSNPDVYAAGDVIFYPDPVFEKKHRVEHWGHAEYSGQVAGKNMAGGENSYDFLSYVWSDIFDLHLEAAGDESECDESFIRGKFEDGSFMVLYLKNKRLTAYFAINANMRDFVPLRRVIRLKKDLTGREEDLENTEFNLRELM